MLFRSVPLLPKKIGDVDVEYQVLDDASDPTMAVQHAKKFLSEGFDAIIGPSGSPNAVAVLGFAAEAKTPLLAPVGSAAVVLPMDEKKKWVFKTTQNDDLIASALVDHMKATGIKTLGLFASSDPYGDTWIKVVKGLVEKAGIKVVAEERYLRSDTSVTGQSLKMLGANPDAVLIASAGAPVVLPHVTLVDQGYRGKIYQTHGAASSEFLKLGGAKIENVVMAASIMLVLDQVGADHPSKKVAEDYIAAYKAANGEIGRAHV